MKFKSPKYRIEEVDSEILNSLVNDGSLEVVTTYGDEESFDMIYFDALERWQNYEITKPRVLIDDGGVKNLVYAVRTTEQAKDLRRQRMHNQLARRWQGGMAAELLDRFEGVPEKLIDEDASRLMAFRREGVKLLEFGDRTSLERYLSHPSGRVGEFNFIFGDYAGYVE